MTTAMTETAPAVQELSETVTHLRTNLETLQREIQQASTVWETALAEEKQEFLALLESKQQSWEADDAKWQKQRAAYEHRIRDLEVFFQEQLTQSERNAVRALNDLDDAWQRDKLKWEQKARQEVQEVEAKSEALYTTSTDILSRHFQQLWESDRAHFSQALEQALQWIQEREAAWRTEQAKHKQQISALQQQLTQAWVGALENQVNMLESIVRGGHARR